ncbi:glycosyl hydrolase [Paenibacillus oryzae]|uniref:Glycosyl hydrolase n=1 Tax=Paenibacillus oryzae TaxID=1844972 RepID=A0A1A5YUY9_9BACL|nr:glycoside hydrolase family 88 protein [Paenibacillus oryzae]OBR69379.1 glycosyl hydrolase [Paenibacillus oryzae]
MASYLEHRESAHYWFGEDEKAVLEVLANRYVGANPRIPFAMRSFSKAGFLQNGDGLYEMDLQEKMPQAGDGAYGYMYGIVWSDDERSLDALLESFGPVCFYVNGALVYRSTAVDELKPGARAVIPLLLRKGWNTLLLEAKRTEAGFGCRFGAEEGKVRILQVLSPFATRSGSAGWVYAGPFSESRFGGEHGVPDFTGTEEHSGCAWLPRLHWSPDEAALSSFERVFKRECSEREISLDGAVGYGWSSIEIPYGVREVILRGEVKGPTSIWLADRLAADVKDTGSYSIAASVEPGVLRVFVKTGGSGAGWGFTLTAVNQANGQELPLKLPLPVHGHDGVWLLAGPCDPSFEGQPDEACAASMLFPSTAPGNYVYWSLDAPDARMRPFYENAMLSNKWTTGSATNYGRWDYPLGVTMYGLLRMGRELGRQDLTDYAISHIRTCTDMYDYSLWDRDEYGFPSINHQLVLIKMLDNCGSFGSAMLEAHLMTGDRSFMAIADRIAEFMLGKLERREDGAFYRLCPGEYSATTMWADDLYMSAPFLIRYAEATGRSEALDEAARQFLLFRSYLLMESEGLMSHVFDFKYGKATRIPWGRGNGWCLFSLTELLEKLPATHPQRNDLLAMLHELCEGIAAVQGESGLWHQVLNRPDAYEEASCTAMFAYAFARGVRFGWLNDPERYTAAALKAWRGLAGEAIDRQGNVHGVCSGSRYSYSADYYMFDLRTVINDNHGIGIMMLAGVEISLLKRTLAKTS